MAAAAIIFYAMPKANDLLTSPAMMFHIKQGTLRGLVELSVITLIGSHQTIHLPSFYHQLETCILEVNQDTQGLQVNSL